MTEDINKTTRKYHVALSFASEDREYVEAVASFLRRDDVKVFYDRFEEVNLWGTDLYKQLRHVYSEASEYIVIFISKHYADKLWTKQELVFAQSRESEESKEYILPARFDETVVIGLPDTTGYIDLKDKTPEQFAALIASKIRPSGPLGASTLRENPLFSAALDEIEYSGNLSHAITNSIIEDITPLEGLDDFLLLLIQETTGSTKLGCVSFSIDCLIKFDVGYEAINYLLKDGATYDEQLERLAWSLQYITHPVQIRWAHNILTRTLKNDGAYHYFLIKHSEFIFKHLSREMIAYLLVPDRGPKEINIDSIMFVAKYYSKPSEFIRRFKEWICGGNFDGKTRMINSYAPEINNSTMGATLLYRILNEIAGMSDDHPLQSLRADVFLRTKTLLSNESSLKTGLYHLYIMRAEEYVDLQSILSRVYDCPSTDPDTLELFRQLKYGHGFDELGVSRLLAERLNLL